MFLRWTSTPSTWIVSLLGLDLKRVCSSESNDFITCNRRYTSCKRSSSLYGSRSFVLFYFAVFVFIVVFGSELDGRTSIELYNFGTIGTGVEYLRTSAFRLSLLNSSLCFSRRTCRGLLLFSLSSLTLLIKLLNSALSNLASFILTSDCRYYRNGASLGGSMTESDLGGSK